MNTVSLGWSPLLPLTLLVGLAGLAVAVLAVGLIRRAPGLGWRVLAAAALLVALGNPALVLEERVALSDIAVAIVDETASQGIGERQPRTEAALAALRERLGNAADVELRVVRVGPGGGGAGPVDGSRLFTALERAMADVPRRRFAGAFMLTDGQVHDLPEAARTFDLGGPLHVLLSGERDEGDRRLSIVQEPSFGIVGQSARLTLRVDDPPGVGIRQARVTMRRDGEAESQTVLVPVGVDHAINLIVDRGGPSVYELMVEDGPRELTQANNRSVVVINGVRDRLRVLLVSGEPHPGERTWRNLLKADPSVDLVHFTILRPPEKQDGTPVRELSLIAFPIRELFEINLHEFDLVIFDRYQRRGVLPQLYLGNIASYVAAGGALLEAAGPTFATSRSLFRTPLASVLPAEPTGVVFEEGFRASVTDPGRRHPVTAALPDGGADQPAWGRWFRHVEAEPRSGTVVMAGARDRPLLVLDRVGDGRVAQLMSDHIWLWARGFEGGGPHAELLRRLSHWLMKEPELEEESLRGEVQADRLTITRSSLELDERAVTVTFPSGRTADVVLEERGQGRSAGSIVVDEAGLYTLSDGTRTALAAVGALNPREFSDVTTTDALLVPFATASGGGVAWLADGEPPEVRRLAPSRAMFGSAAGSSRPWFGLQRNRDFTVTGVSELPLWPAVVILILGLGGLLLAWRREGR